MFREMIENAVYAMRDDLLSNLGLRVRRHGFEAVLPSVGFFVAGALVGGCVALLLAPSSGEQLRAELGERMRELARRWDERGASAQGRAQEVRGADHAEDDGVRQEAYSSARSVI